jgi:hypothetical protein
MKADLMIAATKARNDAVAKIDKDARDKLRTEIAKEAMQALSEYEKANKKQEEAEAKKQKMIETILASSGSALVAGHGDLAQRILKAALEPEVKYLQAMAMKHYALAAKDFATQNWIGAAEQMAGATALMAGAALVGSIGGVGGGGGGGASGGGGGGGASNSATSLGASGGGAASPLQIQLILVTQDQNGRETSRTAQQIQRLNDRNVPIKIGGLG